MSRSGEFYFYVLDFNGDGSGEFVMAISGADGDAGDAA